MKRVSFLGSCLLVGALVLYAAPRALAADTVVAGGKPSCGGSGAVDVTRACATPDLGFTVTGVTVKTSNGVTTLTCTGMTTNFVKNATTTCDGETLNGKLEPTAGSITFACDVPVSGSLVGTDDWTESVSGSGFVKLTCKTGGKDKGKNDQ